jgi:DNA gyrase subunit A
MERFGLDEIQAQKIVEMRLGQLTGMERQKIEEEMAALKAKIAEYTEILSSEENVRAVVKAEAIEAKERFADERRTEICNVSGEVDIEDLIPEEESVYTLTNKGYLKRMPADTYRSQRRGGRGVMGMTRREEDFVQTMFTCSTHDYIMFFTSFGKAYKLKGYEIPESSRTGKGMNAVNILPLEADEKISAMIRVPAEANGEYLCMVTRNGIIKRTLLDAYKNIRKNGVIAINLDDDDELAWVKLTMGDDDLLVATRDGYSIRFNENDARPIGRTARGVKAIELREGDKVVGMDVISDESFVLTVTETGYGRRSPGDEYRCQSRGGKGVTNYKTEKYGEVAALMTVKDDEDIILISSEGIVIRMPADSISLFSRTSKGVRVMRVGDSDKLVTVTTAEREADSEETEEATAEAPAEDTSAES